MCRSLPRGSQLSRHLHPRLSVCLRARLSPTGRLTGAHRVWWGEPSSSADVHLRGDRDILVSIPLFQA